MEREIIDGEIGENFSERLDNLSKYMPEVSIEAVSTHDAFVFQNNIRIGKFIKSNKLTMDEKREFAQKLNDEWLETVVRPYLRNLCDFCEKYEMATMETKINVNAQPMMGLFLEEMLEGGLKGKFDEFFNND